MRNVAATFVVIGLFAVPLGAQRGRAGAQGIPPGQLPPPGACRVWYDNLPPGRQAAPTNCRDAERIASRDRNARVIYGSNQTPGDQGWWERDNRTGPRAIPRSESYPGARYPSGRGGYEYRTVAFDNGYKDGLEKGREDPEKFARYLEKQSLKTHLAPEHIAQAVLWLCADESALCTGQTLTIDGGIV